MHPHTCITLYQTHSTWPRPYIAHSYDGAPLHTHTHENSYIPQCSRIMGPIPPVPWGCPPCTYPDPGTCPVLYPGAQPAHWGMSHPVPFLCWGPTPPWCPGACPTHTKACPHPRGLSLYPGACLPPHPRDDPTM